MKQSEYITKLQQTESWDFIIIGGGSFSLGIVEAAACRSFKNILVAAVDFINSTLSRSTKLVHNCVRYYGRETIYNIWSGFMYSFELRLL